MLPKHALEACLAAAVSSAPAGGSAAAAAAAARLAGTASGGNSSSSSSSQASCGCCFQPTLAQVAAQAGAFCGAPADILPWLQLLSRYHTLSAQLSAETSGLEQKLKDALKGSQDILALAGALGSLGAQLPPLLAAAVQAAREAQRQLASDTAAVLLTLLTQQQQQQQQQRAGMLASTRPQQQHNLQLKQQQDCSFESVGHWVHAERLLRVKPSAWHAHLAEHLLQPPGSSSSSRGSSAAAAASRQRLDGNLLQLLADLACDWCGEALSQQQQEAGAAGSGSSGGGSSAGSKQQQQQPAFGCVSCRAAQYCSKGCADAAKAVHAANCW
jgi:hypothetical protein